MSEAYLGEIRMFAGNYAPQDWALCNGTLLPISSYEALFSILGTQYGGNGVSTFGLPNYCARVPIGQGIGPGLSPRQLTQTLGAETVTMAPENTPPHSHAFVVSSDSAVATSPSPATAPNSQTFGKFPGAGVITGLYSAGTGTSPTVNLNPSFLDPALGTANGVVLPHNNMMGSLAINYIICLVGMYPTRP